MGNGLSTERTMTVKEVANILGVTPEAIKKHVRELFPEYIKNGIETVLTEKQVTEIKSKMIPTTKVVGSTTDIEMEQMTLKVIQYHIQKEQEYKQRAEIAEQKCIEQKPKVEVYDSICDSSTLQDLQTVAQTIGLKNVFKVLLANGIILKDWTHDGTMYYRPYTEFNNYLVTKDGKPYDINGVSHVRPRIFVTGKGITWLTKKYSKDQDEN
jgi:phage antirepressor YoqD-like protein